MVNVYQLIECGDDEMNLVKAKLEKHFALTGSKRAKSILADWPETAGKFLKILPQDYERVQHAVKRAEERGLTGDEAIQAAFEENVKAGH
jgi:glutamate synthase (ferredoxin)